MHATLGRGFDPRMRRNESESVEFFEILVMRVFYALSKKSQAFKTGKIRCDLWQELRVGVSRFSVAVLFAITN